MTIKRGRPPLLGGKAKDEQIAVRFQPRASEVIGAKAALDNENKAGWIRRAAIEATHDWVHCNKWTVTDLHGKTVKFKLVLKIEGPIEGGGKFDVWQNGEGLFKIRIISYHKSSTFYKIDELRTYVPQEGVDLIKKLPAGASHDFSVVDPRFEKYVLSSPTEGDRLIRLMNPVNSKAVCL